MKKESVFVFGAHLVVLLWQLQPGHTQYTSDLEATLLSDLFSGNYSTLVRPSAVVTVNVSFMLYTINDLNIVDQTLSVSGMLTMNWLDPRLVWANDSDYSSVLFLFNTEENTWTPAIYVENSVEDLAVINDENMPMRIMPNGEVSRTPAGVFQVSCESDVTYYPFDKQTCNIKITTSGYTQGEIDLNFNENAVDLSAYVTNGEWEIVSAGGLSTGGQSRTRNGLTFASLSFQFVLKRRYVFHTINTIFPVFLMGILIPFVFKLEEIADKIGYSLTVLLSYAVYLTVIADHIPSTSVAVCYLSVYLAVVLSTSTLSILIVIMGSHGSTTKEKLSPCTKAFAYFLAKLSCQRRSCCRNKTDTAPEGRTNEFYINRHGTLSSKEFRPESMKNSHDYGRNEEITREEFAGLMDKFFFFLFFLFIIIASLTLFVTLGIKYQTY